MQHADKLAILYIYVAHSTPRIIERVEYSDNVASPLNQLQTGSVVIECYVSPVDAFKARELRIKDGLDQMNQYIFIIRDMSFNEREFLIDPSLNRKLNSPSEE